MVLSTNFGTTHLASSVTHCITLTCAQIIGKSIAHLTEYFLISAISKSRESERRPGKSFKVMQIKVQ